MVEPAPDFDEFFGSLTAHHVEFLAVGACALAYHRAPCHTTAPCGSRELPFIGRAEFLRNTRAAGRLKDLADVEALEG